MAHLAIYINGQVRIVPLVPEGDVVIGRHRDCEVTLDDVRVSRRHARMSWDAGQWTIRDLMSSSGVYVNGRHVIASELHHGDRVMVGGVEISYQEHTPTTLNETLARLREVLHDAPGSRAWLEVCTLLETTDPPHREVCVDYVLGAMDRWPSHLRAMPNFWDMRWHHLESGFGQLVGHLRGRGRPLADLVARLRSLPSVGSLELGARDVGAAMSAGEVALPEPARAFEVAGAPTPRVIVDYVSQLLPELSGLESLAIPRLSCQPLLAQLGQARELAGLKRLDLSLNTVAPQDVRTLARSKHLTHVEALLVGQTPLGDEGVLELLEAPFVPALRQLTLVQCGLTDQALLALSRCERLTGLRRLDVRGNAFTGAGLRPLLSDPRFVEMELRVGPSG